MAFYLAQASGTLNSAFPWSFRSVLSSTNTELAVASAWNAAVRGIFTDLTFKTYIPSTVAITQTSVSTASAQFKQTTKTVDSTSNAGTSSSPALPYHTCEIVTFRTANATRWGRGRWYFPALATNALASGGWTMLNTAQNAFQSAMNAYFSAVGTSYQHVILHRKATLGGTRAAFSTDVVTACDIPNDFTVQRRRADKLSVSRVTVTV
jgi:hypothetical protein